MPNFAVVQERFEKIDPTCLRTVLQQQGGLMRPDANRIARRAQGILWNRFTQDEAQRVVAALAQSDYATRVLPIDSIPKLDKPRVVTWLEIDHHALRVPWIADAQWTKDQIKATDEHTILVPWTSVFVINAGQVGHLVQKFAAQDSPYRMEDERMLDSERETRLVLVTDVVAVGDQGQYLHMRLPANELAYSRILPTNQKPDTIFKKYLAVLDALVAHSATAIVSPATRKLLALRENKPMMPRSASMANVETSMFENYNRWLMLLVIFNEQSQDENQGSDM